MRLSRLSILNFRNFEAIDIALANNVVLLGENRVGKSNLLFAIRLVLDPTLPDAAARCLPLSVAGVSAADKLAALAPILAKGGAQSMLVGALDEVCCSRCANCADWLDDAWPPCRCS